jgi:hypothetical protein
MQKPKTCPGIQTEASKATEPPKATDADQTSGTYRPADSVAVT